MTINQSLAKNAALTCFQELGTPSARFSRPVTIPDAPLPSSLQREREVLQVSL